MEMTSPPQPSPGQRGPISVYIIEDHEEYREIVKEIIENEEDMTCPYTFESCEEYLKVIFECPYPDVILMDIDITNKMSGIEGVQKIHDINPEIKIIMLTWSDATQDIIKSMASKAVGYVHKHVDLDVIVSKIRQAAKGDLAFDSNTTKQVQGIFGEMVPPTNDYGLTRREKEVLGLLVEGKTRKQAAELLFVAFPTIDAHVQNIYRKLDVHSVAEAVSKAIKERLLDDELNIN